MAVDKAHPEAGFVEFEPVVIGVVDFIFVIIAVAGLLVVGAGWVFGWLIQELFGGISIFGVHPFGFIGGLLQDATAAIAQPLIKRVVAFGHAAWSVVMVCWRFVYVSTVAIAGLAGQLFGLNQSTGSAINSLKAQEQTDVRNLTNQEARDATNLKNLIVGNTNILQSEITQTANSLSGRITTVQNSLQGVINQDVNAIQARITTVQNSLQGVINQDVNAIQARITASQTALQNVINQDYNILHGQITNGVSTAESFATGAIAGATPGIVAKAVAAVQPQISKITTEIDDCLEPLCDTVTPNASQLGKLGNLLKDLEGLFAAGALMALLVAAVEDPKGTATVVSDAMGWVEPLSLDLTKVVGDAAGVVL